MQGRKSAIRIEIDDDTRNFLQGLLRRQKTPVGVARRARAILLLAAGESFVRTAQQVGLRERHVRKWAQRFVAHGVEGLFDKKRPGRRPVFSPSGSSASGQARWRTTGRRRAVAVAVGLYGVGPPVGG